MAFLPRATHGSDTAVGELHAGAGIGWAERTTKYLAGILFAATIRAYPMACWLFEMVRKSNN